MEGSTMSTPTAYSMLGYTKANMAAVDEFIALEGSACTDRTTTALMQKAGKSGTQYWVNKRYVEADVVISIPTMKTHLMAGITGGVKNLGVGVTPMGQFSPADGGTANDCTRAQGAGANSIDHSSPEALGAFIRDYYSLRPADFVVMDALQGIQHGPAPAFEAKPGDAGYWDYASGKMNMRLILAGRNAVAVDTVEALVMKCDPKKVPHLTKLEADGHGTTDLSQISVVGKQMTHSAVARVRSRRPGRSRASRPRASCPRASRRAARPPIAGPTPGSQPMALGDEATCSPRTSRAPWTWVGERRSA
jgi:uncharacterized protein (DUF362 family)